MGWGVEGGRERRSESHEDGWLNSRACTHLLSALRRYRSRTSLPSSLPLPPSLPNPPSPTFPLSPLSALSSTLFAIPSLLPEKPRDGADPVRRRPAPHRRDPALPPARTPPAHPPADADLPKPHPCQNPPAPAGVTCHDGAAGHAVAAFLWSTALYDASSAQR